MLLKLSLTEIAQLHRDQYFLHATGFWFLSGNGNRTSAGAVANNHRWLTASWSPPDNGGQRTDRVDDEAVIMAAMNACLRGPLRPE